MNKTLLITREKGVDCACLIEDGRLTEYISRNTDASPKVGNIYLGTVVNIVPALGCAFVEIGDKRTAMLPINEIPASILSAKCLKSGMELAVQVTKLPGSDKGVLVTANLKLPGKDCVLLPFTNTLGISKKIEDEAVRANLKELGESVKPKDMGLILRTTAKDCAKEELQSDLNTILDYWHALSVRISFAKAPALLHDDSDVVMRSVRDMLDATTDRVIVADKELLVRVRDEISRQCPEYLPIVTEYDFDISPFALYKLTSQLETAKARKVYLQGGGFLIFDKTEALHVIDVNSGTYTGSASIADTAYITNMEAAEEIVRQIRLRDLGGIIIIDFIDMDTKQRKDELVSYLRSCFKTDHAKTNVVGMTGLGLIELTRKKRNDGTKTFPSPEQTND